MKKYVNIIGLIVVVLYSSVCWGWGVSGKLEYRGEYYPDRDRKDDWGSLGELDFTIEESFMDRKFRVSVNPLVRFDNLEYVEGFMNDWGSEDRTRSYVALNKAYVEWHPIRWLSVGTGIKDFQWGVAEEINPTNFNPTDWLDVIGFESVGVPAVWARISLPWGAYFEAVGSKFVPSKLPLEEENPWRPPELEDIEVMRPDRKDAAQFSARLGGSWKWVDVGFTFFQGYSDFPGFETETIAIKPPSWFGVSLKPKYFWLRKYGLNLATDLPWGIGLKAEAAWFDQNWNQDCCDQDNFVQSVLGIDRLWEWDDFTVFILLQYIREDVTHHGFALFQEFDLRRVFKDALAGQIELEFWEDWKLELKGVFGFENEGQYIQPKLTRYLGEGWEVSLGYDYLDGPEDSFFGRYEENSRLFMELNYYF